MGRAKNAATKTFALKPGKRKNGYENTFKTGKVFESGEAKFHRFIVRPRSILSLTVYATIVANLKTVRYYAFQKRNVERLQNTWPTKCLNWKTAPAVPQSLACENIRFSSLFAARDVSRGGTSATQRQKFHTDDANQCLHNKSGSHGVPNINLSNFTCLLVYFGKVLCLSANYLQQNSNASSREDYIPQVLTVLLGLVQTSNFTCAEPNYYCYCKVRRMNQLGRALLYLGRLCRSIRLSLSNGKRSTSIHTSNFTCAKPNA